MTKKTLDKSDFTNLRIDENQEPWSQVCHIHIDQLKDVKNEWGVGSGMCGVDGCKEVSDRYIDFK